MIRKLLPLVITVLCIGVPSAVAAEWFQLSDTKFSTRHAVKITNDANVPVKGWPVRIPLKEIKPDGESKTATVILVDQHAKEAMVPHQVVRDVLTFSASLAPKASKTYYLYVTDQEIKPIKFQPQTSVDIRPNHAYRSFENNKMAFRVEVGEGANTTGMAIDLFGKTKAGQQMGAILASRIYTSDYHEMQDWGIDTLKIGSSPGLAGVYVVDGEKMGRNIFATTSFEIVEGPMGPVMSRVRVKGPVEVNGKKVEVVRTLTLTADDRGIDDVVEIRGDGKVLEGLKLGLGVRNLPNDTWNEDAKAGFAYVDGDGNQKGTDHLGMGLAFVPAQYVRTEEIKTVATTTSPSAVDKVNGGHIVVLTPETKKGALRSHHHLGAYWNGDGEITKREDFEKLLKDSAVLLSKPVRVDVGDAEKKE